MTPEQITAAAGVLVGVLGWFINHRRVNHDVSASLIDDLAGQLSAARAGMETAEANMRAANATIRATLDYVYVLRSQLQQNDLTPEPWPEHLVQR